MNKVIEEEKPYYGYDQDIINVRENWSKATIQLAKELRKKNVKLVLFSPLNYQNNELIITNDYFLNWSNWLLSYSSS